MIWGYLAGYLVALGYQLIDDDFRRYDAIVCPIIWPAVLVGQIVLAALLSHDRYIRRKQYFARQRSIYSQEQW